jgi:hypothetical protein
MPWVDNKYCVPSLYCIDKDAFECLTKIRKDTTQARDSVIYSQSSPATTAEQKKELSLIARFLLKRIRGLNYAIAFVTGDNYDNEKLKASVEIAPFIDEAFSLTVYPPKESVKNA